MIVDFHTHTFPDKIAHGVIEKLQAMSCSKPYTDATTGALRRSMERAEIDYSVLLPVMTNPGQVEKLNRLAAETNAKAGETGLLSFGGMHPEFSGYRQELARLQELGLKGIKLHPAYQGMDVDALPFLRIIDRASELGLAILVHAGIDIGIPGHDYSAPEHILHVMQEIAPDKLILAHMGGWRGWDRVEEMLVGRSLYMDTSFSLGKIVPPHGMHRKPGDDWMLSDEQFVRMVRKHGADKILFATDCPWSDQQETVQHIRSLPLTEEEKQQIFGENAKRLLGLEERN